VNKARFALSVMVSIFAAAAFGQVRETVNVHLVEVPVNVVDANGNPIRGLKPENFEIVDGKKKRPVAAFDTIDFASAESLKGVSPLNPAARRSFLLLFDLSYSQPNSLDRARTAARKFVKEIVQKRDLVAVATVDVDHGFRLLTAFTTDRQLTAAAIDEPFSFRSADPLQIANTTAYDKLDRMSNSKGTDVDAGVIGDHMKNLIELATKANEEFVRRRIETEIGALDDLARTLRAVAGRKQIVLLSEGFDPKALLGRDARDITNDQQELAQVTAGAFWRADVDARLGNTASQTLLGRMAKTFRGSDVVMHALDIRGVRVQNNVVDGAIIDSNQGLYALTRPTGGEVFQNSNDLGHDFAKLMHQQEVVYVLGFRAPAEQPGAFHELTVRLVGVPKGARISHRAGYYESGGESRQERVLTNAEIIMNDIAQSGVRVDALAAAFPQRGGPAQVPVILQIDCAETLKNYLGELLPVEIFLYAFDADGIVRDRAYQQIALDLDKVGARLRDGGVKYYGSLALPEGAYAIKALVRVGDGTRRGFVRTDVVVPRAGDVAVTGLVPVDEHPRAVLIKASGGTAWDDDPFQVNGQRFVPDVAGRAGAGPQKFALFVRGLAPDAVNVETKPDARVARHAADDGSVLLLQLDAPPAPGAALDVVVKRSGGPDMKASVPIAR
jgi:VWFA-related protein